MVDARSGQVVIGSRDDIYLQIWGYPIILNSESVRHFPLKYWYPRYLNCMKLLLNAPASDIVSGADACL